MSDLDYRRWTVLIDRLADGDELSEQEQSFCDDYAAQHPACARELQFMDELADLDAAPDAASGALVDSVLSALAEEEAGDGETDSDPLPILARISRAQAIVAATAVAAACTLIVVSGGEPNTVGIAELAQPAPHSSRLEIVYTSGQTFLGEQAAVAGGSLLATGDVIEVGEGSICMVLEPNIDVCLDGNSQLRVGAIDGPHRQLELLRGRVALQLDKQPEGMSITVLADGVESTAIGTVFTVARTPTGVATTVLEGRVRVRRNSDAQLVDAHRRVEISGDRQTHSTLTRAQEGPEWELLAPRALWGDQLSGELRVSSTPDSAAGASVAEISLDGRPIGRAPLSTLLPTGHHELVVTDGERVLLRRSFETLPGQREVVLFEVVKQPEEVEQAVAPTVVRRDRVRSPGELLSGARHMMVEGRWGAAADVYRSLRRLHPRSAEAHTVLVSLGQLELDRLGDPKRALSLLDRYLGKGSGMLAEEARYTRIRALRRLGHTAGEIDAIKLFLSAHPKSFHDKVLRRRLVALDEDDE